MIASLPAAGFNGFIVITTKIGSQDDDRAADDGCSNNTVFDGSSTVVLLDGMGCTSGWGEV